MLSDKRAREQALDISRSFIVQAPAGSGKTTLLTQRFMALVLSPAVKNPEEIIAITFTRKAAGEMRQRILSVLDHIAPDRLRIMTIDAFCGFLSAQMPLASKLGKDFVISENPEYLYEKAIERLFSAPPLTGEPFLADFLLLLDNDFGRAKNLLIEILQNRDQWLPYMPEMLHDNAIENLEKSWKNLGFSYSGDQKKFMTCLAEVLLYLLAELKLMFNQTQQYDFVEIMLRALEALGTEESPTDLALKLDYQIKHLLIDEFQDTSSSQWRLLQKITAGWESHDGRTLFLVGDPMQSIYRFRKAEVSLFLEVQRHGIGQIKLDSLTLTTNFRSHPALIEWFNQSFSAIFPQKSDSLLGAVTYTPSQGIENSHQLPSPQHQAVFYYDINHNINHPETSEENKILEIIQKNPDQSIAVLVRSRSHLKEIINILQKNKITFRALDIAMLSDHPLIEDLFSLTRALLHPADKIAWLAILRAPWCGLTLAQLYQLAGKEHDKTIWDLLHSHSLQPHPPRLSYFIRIMDSAINKRGRISLRELVEQTWLNLQGYLCLSAAGVEEELTIAETYFDLLDKVQDISSIEKQLKYLSLPIQSVQSQSNSNSNINLMTIHKAKGLEFDIVILPKLEKITRPDQSRLFLWEERLHSSGSMDLFMAPLPAKNTKENIYDYLKLAENARSEYELQRLLYVAATRAKKSLHLLFSVNLKNPAKKSFLHLLWPLISNQFNLRNKPEKALKTSLIHPPRLKKLPDDILDNNNNNINFISDISESRGKNYAVFLPAAQLQLRHIGTVVHEALNLISQAVFLPEKYYLSRLYQLSGSKENFELIQQCLNNIHTDPVAQWILKPHLKAASEYAISGLIENKINHIIIDRTFIDENNQRWIIDYKITEQVSLENHRSQLEKYARIFSQFDSHSHKNIQLGLYFPLVKKWICWEF